MARIVRHDPHGEIDDKRFYLPGVVLEDTCPSGDHVVTMDLGEQYLSYPIIGAVDSAWWYCGQCEDAGRRGEDVNWRLNYRLNISLELIDG